MTGNTLGGWMVHVMRQADGALSLEEALHVIMDSVKQYFPCQSIAVLLIDDDTKELRIKISRQISYTFVKKFHGQGPGATAERVVLEQRPLLLDSVDPESETYSSLKLEHDFTSAVLAPIINDQRGIGYIFGDRAAGEPFNESDLLHLQVVGYLIGSLIEKFELIQQRKKLSQIDDASLALQYKAFIPTMVTELQRGIEHKYTICLALLAVDAFRKYIETYGIDAAHALLAEVVEITKKELRDMDILARFGADEFILCLSGLSTEESVAKLETIRDAIGRDVVGQGDFEIHVTTGGLLLESTESKQRSLQDILGALGRKLVDAKAQGVGSIVSGPLE